MRRGSLFVLRDIQSFGDRFNLFLLCCQSDLNVTRKLIGHNFLVVTRKFTPSIIRVRIVCPAFFG